MPGRITLTELRVRSAEIFRAVEGGESFIVTRNGAPVAELTPVPRRRFVPAEVAIAAFTGAPRVDMSELRADLDALVDG